MKYIISGALNPGQYPSPKLVIFSEGKVVPREELIDQQVKDRLSRFYFPAISVKIPHPYETTQPDDVFVIEYWRWNHEQGCWRNYNDWYIDQLGRPTPNDRTHPKTTIGPQPSPHAWECLLKEANKHGFQEGQKQEQKMFIVERKIPGQRLVLDSEEAILLAEELFRASEESEDHRHAFDVDIVSPMGGAIRISVLPKKRARDVEQIETDEDFLKALQDI